jgi:hypothetical protein
MSRPRTFLCLGAVTAGLTSCTLSFSAGSVNDSEFRAVWSPGWTAVNASAKPLKASAGKPGACDIGGETNACFRAGQDMIAALSKLESNLATVQTPHEYAVASSTIQQGVRTGIKGLTDRNSAIMTRDNKLFTKGLNELQTSANLLAKGYGQFPEPTRPTPVPLGGSSSG